MVDREAIEAGLEFEREIAERLGAQLQPGSGNQWYAKLDVNDVGNFLFSLKHTDRMGMRIEPQWLTEMFDAVHAPGGVGGDTIPGMVLGIGGRAYLLLELNDAVRVLQEKRRLGVQSKAEARRERARVPILFREEE